MACKTNVSSLPDGAGTATAPQIRHPANEDTSLRKFVGRSAVVGVIYTRPTTAPATESAMQPSDIPSRAAEPLAAPRSTRRPGPSGALTTTEAAAFLGVSERTLRRYLALGLLTYGRLPGGHYRLMEETLVEFLARHGSKPRYAPNVASAPKQRPGAPSDARRERPRGQGTAAARYDLSLAGLAALRDRHSGRR
jgi:excisionase family DNA binding protein